MSRSAHRRLDRVSASRHKGEDLARGLGSCYATIKAELPTRFTRPGKIIEEVGVIRWAGYDRNHPGARLPDSRDEILAAQLHKWETRFGPEEVGRVVAVLIAEASE